MKLSLTDQLRVAPPGVHLVIQIKISSDFRFASSVLAPAFPYILEESCVNIYNK